MSLRQPSSTDSGGAAKESKPVSNIQKSQGQQKNITSSISTGRNDKEPSECSSIEVRFINRPDGTPLTTIIERNSCSTLNSKASTLPTRWRFIRKEVPPISEGSIEHKTLMEPTCDQLRDSATPLAAVTGWKAPQPSSRVSTETAIIQTGTVVSAASYNPMPPPTRPEKSAAPEESPTELTNLRSAKQTLYCVFNTLLRILQSQHVDKRASEALLIDQCPRRAIIPPDMGKASWQLTNEPGKVICEVQVEAVSHTESSLPLKESFVAGSTSQKDPTGNSQDVTHAPISSTRITDRSPTYSLFPSLTLSPPVSPTFPPGKTISSSIREHRIEPSYKPKQDIISRLAIENEPARPTTSPNELHSECRERCKSRTGKSAEGSISAQPFSSDTETKTSSAKLATTGLGNAKSASRHSERNHLVFDINNNQSALFDASGDPFITAYPDRRVVHIHSAALPILLPIAAAEGIVRPIARRPKASLDVSRQDKDPIQSSPTVVAGRGHDRRRRRHTSLLDRLHDVSLVQTDGEAGGENQSAKDKEARTGQREAKRKPNKLIKQKKGSVSGAWGLRTDGGRDTPDLVQLEPISTNAPLPSAIPDEGQKLRHRVGSRFGRIFRSCFCQSRRGIGGDRNDDDELDESPRRVTPRRLSPAAK
ncbi:hypothetical protein EJ05DRAFT_488903 [Pseudovirgaria hyperparasitica]|uniref:Uncharacterized protein n=1 Tax=Pseudovirgaria hyperparasitica TaxID=470096 RepID=A0A6A6W0Z4_9PEZI|nr:uncharacterized protein EJ05DRAFT_488903 [Pseudovirgaria hyperparasitica]KAF2754751.1 hypothetical protein EJ05DRAFT_488903 [Pseudovirgaria hyperparasitica]